MTTPRPQAQGIRPHKTSQSKQSENPGSRKSHWMEIIAYYEDRAKRASDPTATRHFLEKIIRLNDRATPGDHSPIDGGPGTRSRIELHLGRAHLELANAHLDENGRRKDPDEGRLYLDRDAPVLNSERKAKSLSEARRAFQAARRNEPESPDPLIGLSLASAKLSRLVDNSNRKAYLLLESIATGATAAEKLKALQKNGENGRSIFSDDLNMSLTKHLAETALSFGKFLSYRADKEIYTLQEKLLTHQTWTFEYPSHFRFLFDAKKYNVSEKADLLYRTFLLSREWFKEADQISSDAGHGSLECKIRTLECEVQIGRFSHELDKPREAQEKLDATIKQLTRLKKAKIKKDPRQEESLACLLGDAYLRMSQLRTDKPEECAKHIITSLTWLRKAKDLYHKTIELSDDLDPGVALTRQLDFQAKAYHLLGEALTRVDLMGIRLRKRIRNLFSQDKIERPPGSPDGLGNIEESEGIQYAKEAFCASIEATRIAHDPHGDDSRSRYHLGLSHMWLARANCIEFLARKAKLQSWMMAPLFSHSPAERLLAVSRIAPDRLEQNLNPCEKDAWLENIVFDEVLKIAMSRSFSPRSAAADMSYLIVETEHLGEHHKGEPEALIRLGKELYSYAAAIRETIEDGRSDTAMISGPDPRFTYLMSLIKDTFKIKGSRTAGRAREALMRAALDPRRLGPEETYWLIRKEIDREMPTNIHRLLQIELIADLEKAAYYFDLSVKSDPTYLRPAYEKMRIPYQLPLDEITFPTIDGEWPEAKLAIKNPERLSKKAMIEEFKRRKRISGKDAVFYHLGKGKGGWVKSKYGFLPIYEKEMSPTEAKLIKRLYPDMMIDYEQNPGEEETGVALLHDGGKDMQRQICTLIGEIKTLNKFLRDGVGDPRAIKRELTKKTSRRISMYLAGAKDIPKTCKALLEEIDTGGAKEDPYHAGRSAATHIREALRRRRLPDRLDRDGKRREYRVKDQKPIERPQRPIFTIDGELLHVRPFQTPDDYILRMYDSFIKYSHLTFSKHPRTGLLRFLIHYTRHIAKPLAARERTLYFDAKPPNKLAHGFCDLNSLKWTHVEENWASYLCSEGAEMPGLKVRPNFRQHEMTKLLTTLHRETCREFPMYKAPIEDVLANWHSVEAGKALTLLGHEHKQQTEEINERLRPEQRGYWMRRSERAARYYQHLIMNTLAQAAKNEIIPGPTRAGIMRFLGFMKNMKIEPRYDNAKNDSWIAGLNAETGHHN